MTQRRSSAVHVIAALLCCRNILSRLRTLTVSWRTCRKILHDARANVLNVSIRHALPDRETLLAWAPEEMFSLVIYFEQGTQARDREAVYRWTNALMDAALAEGGTYYLPYQIVATRGQFLRAYPAAPHFFAIKARLDPLCKFRNRLWDRYDPAPACHAVAGSDELRDPGSERRQGDIPIRAGVGNARRVRHKRRQSQATHPCVLSPSGTFWVAPDMLSDTTTAEPSAAMRA